jgi:hypothetical protein
MNQVKKITVGAMVALTAFCVMGAVALASPAPPVTTDTDMASTIVIAAPIVTLIVSLLIPLINGIITTAKTASWVKGVITIVLNAASALITTGLLVDGTSAFSTTALYTAVLGTIISVVSYFNLWKPLNASSNPGGKLANVGLK